MRFIVIILYKALLEGHKREITALIFLHGCHRWKNLGKWR